MSAATGILFIHSNRLYYPYLLLYFSFTVVLSGVQFALESQVEDEVTAANKLNMNTGLSSVQSVSAGVPQMQDAPMKGYNAGNENSNMDGKPEMNRSQRRMKDRIADKDKK